jgi:SAM-dependent methyltransferase
VSAPRVAVGQGRAHDTREPDVETASDGYAARFAGPTGSWMLEVQARRALELVRSVEPGPLSVLDVGGGHGQLVAPLLSAGHRVVVHGSRPACHRRLAPRAGLARVSANLWALPFRDRSFDLVTGIRLLAHVVEWRELLAEMSRVSRRLVLVDFPVRGALHRLAPSLFGAKQKLEGNTRPYFDYAPGEVEAALGAAGLAPAGLAREFALPMVLHRGVRSPALSRGLESLASGLGLTRRIGSPILLLARRQ